MTNILLRATKDPFEVVSPQDTLLRNGIANNSGNLIFQAASYKILATRGTTVTPDRLVVDESHADEINERYDAYVIPLANAFRPTYQATLDLSTRLIRRLDIPVTVLGVGAQSGRSNFAIERLHPIERSVKAFVGAVLDHSPSIGVRGEWTYDYVRGLGFRDVEVIGCPSMFYNGSHMAVEKRTPTLKPDANLAINVTPYVKRMGSIVASHHESYANLRYYPQDIETLELLLWGESARAAAHTDNMPFHSQHPLFLENKVRFFVDPWPWMEALRTADFAFGSRIHGNITALLVGTPSFVLAHDSRTLELARYFEIPHRHINDVRPHVDASDLYAEADYGPLNRGHAARFATFTDYLSRHGLDHVFTEGQDPTLFDRRVAAINYPPGVDTNRRLGARTRGRLKRKDMEFRSASRMRWHRVTGALPSRSRRG